MLFSETKIQIKDQEHQVKVADNFIARGWGLSLQKEGKMLFKFPRKTEAAIDMALLSKPLNLYFLDEKKGIINIQRAEPWTLKPSSWKIYRPQQKYKYLLESFKDLELQEGDKIRF